MAETSTIEWTDATWNPITGCSIVSPGCTNCYAMKLAGTRLKHHPSRKGLTIDSKAGPVWNGKVRLNADWLDQPLRWKRPRMIFVCAHGDLFHESVPDEWIDMVFAVMALAPQHTFQVLTKRAERMRAYLVDRRAIRRIYERVCELTVEQTLPVVLMAPGVPDPEIAPHMPRIHLGRWPLPNVWLGVSSERQQEADERIPHLLAAPAAIRFVSAEPLLGPIDLRRLDQPNAGGGPYWIDALIASEMGWFSDEAATIRHTESDPLAISDLPAIDWVIVGGESGNGGRPMHPDWARSLRDQCAAAKVPFFFKQWGEFHPSNEHAPDVHKACEATPAALHVSGKREYRPLEAGWLIWQKPGWAGMCAIGKNAAGRRLDGVEHNGMPRMQP